jgi:D-Tyr-tRNAtyr deacylase
MGSQRSVSIREEEDRDKKLAILLEEKEIQLKVFKENENELNQKIQYLNEKYNEVVDNNQ